MKPINDAEVKELIAKLPPLETIATERCSIGRLVRAGETCRVCEADEQE